MKTYRSDRYRFEIQIPDHWEPNSVPRSPLKEVFQYGCYEEAFHFEVGPLYPEPLLKDMETEFRLYTREQGFLGLGFRRIEVGGREHVCAYYYIRDWTGVRWNKKYMLVFGGIEYTITGTCNDAHWFAQREKAWDAIVQTFHRLDPVNEYANSTLTAAPQQEKKRQMIQQHIEMRQTTGELYARGYDAAMLNHYSDARLFLEQCLRENPDHVPAHKDLAMVLQKTGDIQGALLHRREQKRLAPGDIANRVRLAELLASSGRRGEALIEIHEALAARPAHPQLYQVEERIRYFRYTDYRLMFYGCLITLLVTDFGLWKDLISIRSLWIQVPLLLILVYGIVISSPWVGMSKLFTGLVALVLSYLCLNLAR